MPETETPPANEAVETPEVQEGQTNAPEQTPETPTTEEKLYAGKFKTPEDLEKAYTEAQRALTRKSQEAAEAKKGQEFIPDKPEEPEISDVNTLVSKSGLDPNELADYYNEHGDLSDEHIAALQKASNLPAGVIRDAAAGLAARAQQAASAYQAEYAKAADAVGGEERLGDLVQWAQNNLSQTEINFMNESINKDPSQLSTFADALQAKYNRETGTTPRQDLASASSSQTSDSSVSPFKNLGEKAEAMNDRRYDERLSNGQSNPHFDSAYRDEVMARMRATAQARAEGQL